MKNRKRIVCMGLATVMTATLMVGCGEKKVEKPAAVETGEQKEDKADYRNPEVETAEDALALLKEGNARFVKGESERFDIGEERLAELSKGQKPFAVVVACADSRVAPEHLFNQGLGDIFVVRVAGNVLDSNEIASVEYAVEHLGSPLVVVLGHDDCGAVGATYDSLEKPGSASTHLDALMGKIKPAVEQAKKESTEKEEIIAKAIDFNVVNGVEQLLKDSSVLSEKAKGGLKIAGATYKLSTGEVVFSEDSVETPAEADGVATSETDAEESLETDKTTEAEKTTEADKE